jgi:hypothetical protein
LAEACRTIRHATFRDIPALLQPGDLIVVKASAAPVEDGTDGMDRGCTSWSPTSSTSPTAATTPAGRSPATPAWMTGNWWSTGSATPTGCA